MQDQQPLELNSSVSRCDAEIKSTKDLIAKCTKRYNQLKYGNIKVRTSTLENLSGKIDYLHTELERLNLVRVKVHADYYALITSEAPYAELLAAMEHDLQLLALRTPQSTSTALPDTSGRKYFVYLHCDHTSAIVTPERIIYVGIAQNRRQITSLQGRSVAHLDAISNAGGVDALLVKTQVCHGKANAITLRDNMIRKLSALPGSLLTNTARNGNAKPHAPETIAKMRQAKRNLITVWQGTRHRFATPDTLAEMIAEGWSTTKPTTETHKRPRGRPPRIRR